MITQVQKKSELFLKALEDVWVAEQIWQGSPNNAAWHCTQAVEKTLKGFLRCHNQDFEYGHELKELLDAVDSLVDITPETAKNILYIDRFGTALRYKTMLSDPTTSEARTAIVRTKEIIEEIGSNANTSTYMIEAQEAHAKIIIDIEEK